MQEKGQAPSGPATAARRAGHPAQNRAQRVVSDPTEQHTHVRDQNWQGRFVSGVTEQQTPCENRKRVTRILYET